MLINREKIVEIAQKFDKICRENNIWYSLDKNTLLGAIRHGGFVPWEVKFEVMTTMEGIEKLQRLFPQNIVDSSKDSTLKSLKTFFVEDSKKWTHDQPFIEIRVVVPTTADKYVKYASSLEAIKKIITFKKDNQKHAINDLYVQKNEGFILVDHTRKEKYENSWIQVLTFKVVNAQISGIDFPVIAEYDTFLKQIFGNDYMKNHSVPHKTFVYPAPLKSVMDEN